jgi:hypothetical protein
VASPRRNIALLDDADRLADAYRSSALIRELAEQVGVSPSTVRRALVRHGIERLPRNRNRRSPAAAGVLDDPGWLEQRYRTRTGVEIAAELGVSSRTVYAAMERHGIARRTEPGALKLRRPELVDGDWLERAVENSSSTRVAAELGVSPGTVTAAYERAGIDPASTPKLYGRGRESPWDGWRLSCAPGFARSARRVARRSQRPACRPRSDRAPCDGTRPGTSLAR